MPNLAMRQTEVYELNPLTDPGWDAFVERHPHGGIFHTSGWLQALQDTYQYRPTWVTTTAPGAPLAEGMLFCEVNSWLTGRRLVSLPFSDHCDPLAASSAEVGALVDHLHTTVAGGKYRYVEFRPSADAAAGISDHPDSISSESFLLHTLFLDLTLDELFRRLHKNCIQHKIRRAERECLRYMKGRTEPMLEQFYQLLLRTRRRHRLPPQPLQWFRNLSNRLGDRLEVHVACKSDQAVAAIITLRFKQTVTYKYGCSDERFANLGCTPFLFWKIVEEAKSAGALRIDLGRTETENSGLATFKERLGGTRQTLNYYRLSESAPRRDLRKSWLMPLLRPAFSYIPDSVLAVSGRLLYRHIG